MDTASGTPIYSDGTEVGWTYACDPAVNAFGCTDGPQPKLHMDKACGGWATTGLGGCVTPCNMDKIHMYNRMLHGQASLSLDVHHSVTNPDDAHTRDTV